MTERPDDIAWIPESQMLDFCRLSRSTFHSWKKSGLDIVSENAAYGLNDLLCLVILGAARKFLPPKKMIGAWRRLESNGEATSILIAARQLEQGGCFDL